MTILWNGRHLESPSGLISGPSVDPGTEAPRHLGRTGTEGSRRQGTEAHWWPRPPRRQAASLGEQPWIQCRRADRHRGTSGRWVAGAPWSPSDAHAMGTSSIGATSRPAIRDGGQGRGAPAGPLTVPVIHGRGRGRGVSRRSGGRIKTLLRPPLPRKSSKKPGLPH